MFLDDELLKMCQDSNPDTPEKLQQLNVDICSRCEDYYKSKLNKNSSPEQVKNVLDRTFNLFDSFVRMALKSEDYKVKILGELFEKNSFKKQFLSNLEMYIIYNNL